MDKNFENQRKIEKIINESLDKIMSERFGRYAKYVIQQSCSPRYQRWSKTSSTKNSLFYVWLRFRIW